MQAFDIEVAMDDAGLKAKMTAVHTTGESAKQLAALDDEVHGLFRCSFLDPDYLP